MFLEGLLVENDHTLTHPAPAPPGMGSVLERNLQRMRIRRADEEVRARLSERLSDRITSFAGSMTFVGLHAAAYGAWIFVNLGWIVILAMEASVEAIFLSTFVLISQNRMMNAAAKQSDLDLQINLHAEHELTRLVVLVDAIAQKIGVEAVERAELEEIKQDVSPEAVLDQLDADARA